MYIHVVSQGESLSSIAARYNISKKKLARENQIDDHKNLVSGQTLVITGGELICKVTDREDLKKVAEKYNTEIDEIIKMNPQLKREENFKKPVEITVPPLSINKSFPDIKVNGYCYPHINLDFLDNISSLVKYISIFSYNLKENGNLVELKDKHIINESKNNILQMVVTNLGEVGFNSELVKKVLENKKSRNNLINNIKTILITNNYQGVNIDFEKIPSRIKGKYHSFLDNLTKELHREGFFVSTALPPKYSKNNPKLYEAYDYSFQGDVVDYVILMTYDWGYSGGPPRAVALANEIEKVLNYAESVIPSNKILMGIPLYGRDWQVSPDNNFNANTYSCWWALNRAQQQNVEIKFDQKAQTPYYYWYQNGEKRVVWFEDARSISEKFKLINKYSLGGISYWQLGFSFPQNWVLLKTFLNSN